MTGFEDRLVARRGVLGTIGAGVTVAVAGCLGDDDDEEGDGDGNDADGASGSSDGEGETQPEDASYPDQHVFDHPGDEPVEFTGDQSCPVCTMTPSDYSDWQCQLAHEDGTGAAFDTPGCLFAYAAFPPTDADVTAGWVTDYESGELIDATEAHYVLVTDETAVRGETMTINPRPFADRDDAVAYLDEWDAEDLTEDDIIQFDEIDRDVAAIYRENRFP